VKLLLDTHIWVWGILEPERIAGGLARVLESSKNELWLSPVSVWEALVLAHKKRLTLEPDAEKWVRHWLRERPFHEAPLNREVAIESRRVSLPHEDPADRFLAATALVYDLTLVTADQPLLNCKQIRSLANR
jgi:PIN domain nuclease of toxin-antitoxin system